MNKILKYSLLCGMTAIVIYFSIDIQSLDAHLSENASNKFDPEQYVEHYWQEVLSMDTAQATSLEELKNALQQQQLNKITKKVGISDYVYTFFKGTGRVNTINDEFIFCETQENTLLKIKTKYIFDSNVRNASRQIDIGEFKTIIDYNLVSKALNEKIRTDLLDDMNQEKLLGEKIRVVGAIEIHDTTTQFNNITITPVSIELLP